MSPAGSETYRLEAFADAVFAIAITLLIIEIRLPAHEELRQLGGLRTALLHLWPSYLGYVISFVVIGIMWANHHNLMKLIDRVDHGFITLNLLLLLCVAFLPFPTAVMAELLTDLHERSVAVAFYCGCFTITAVFYFLMWWHAARGRRLIAPHVPDSAVRAITRAYAPGSLLYLAATLLAFVHVAISLSIVLGLAILYMLPRAGAHAAVATNARVSEPEAPDQPVRH
jgi:TMEM175 potassium channel family protein